MMQMQKLQLEAAAAAAAAQVQAQQNIAGGLVPSSCASGGNVSVVEEQHLDPNEVVMIGNVAFPKSMFESIIPDIDEDAALKAMQIP